MSIGWIAVATVGLIGAVIYQGRKQTISTIPPTPSPPTPSPQLKEVFIGIAKGGKPVFVGSIVEVDIIAMTDQEMEQVPTFATNAVEIIPGAKVDDTAVFQVTHGGLPGLFIAKLVDTRLRFKAHRPALDANLIPLKYVTNVA